MDLSREDLEELRRAKALLENPSLAARIADAVGTPIEVGFRYLPDAWRGTVARATQRALQSAMDLALVTLGDDVREPPSNSMHKAIVAATGAGGGVFGLGGLTVELPISTTIMLRSIADIARSHGEQIKLPETKLACMQVFALGGRTAGDDAAESGYFAVRSALAYEVKSALDFVARHRAAKSVAPALVRLIGRIGERFGIAVTQKAAAQAIPVIGAVGGALINMVFIDHFQDIARGHFTVRRLERIYGAAVVRRAYNTLSD